MTTVNGYTSSLNIIECMDHPQLFQRWFEGSSWNAWKAILKASYCLPMWPTDVEFFRSVAGGREVPKARVKELWVAAGRRGGKSAIAR